METRLTTKEVARLYSKDERTIQRWAKSNKLKADCVYNQFNSPEYVFSVDDLDKPIQEKYFAQVKASLPKPAIAASKKDKPFDHYTDDERQEIMWWEKTLKALLVSTKHQIFYGCQRRPTGLSQTAPGTRFIVK